MAGLLGKGTADAGKTQDQNQTDVEGTSAEDAAKANADKISEGIMTGALQIQPAWTQDTDWAAAQPAMDSNEEYIDEDLQTGKIPIFKTFKHKMIRRFSVGDFHFREHLLDVYSQDEYDRFIELWKTLMPIDRNAIVIYNRPAEASLETAIKPTAIRGPATTGLIKDTKTIS